MTEVDVDVCGFGGWVAVLTAVVTLGAEAGDVAAVADAGVGGVVVDVWVVVGDAPEVGVSDVVVDLDTPDPDPQPVAPKSAARAAAEATVSRRGHRPGLFQALAAPARGPCPITRREYRFRISRRRPAVHLTASNEPPIEA